MADNDSATPEDTLLHDPPDKTLDEYEREWPPLPPLDKIVDGFLERKADDFFSRNFAFNNYTRMRLEMEDHPFPLLAFELDTSISQMFYLQESYSAFTGNAFEGYHEKVLATRVSGDDRGVSSNYFVNSPLDPRLRLFGFPPFLERGLVSPASGNARFYYNFDHVNTFQSEGEWIHTLEVTPRRAHDPAFDGYIYVVDESWDIAGIDIEASNIRHNGLLDYISIKQHFVNYDNTWVPSTQEIHFNAQSLGFSFSGSIYSEFSDFSADAAVADTLRNFITIENEAIRKPYAFWNESRPFQLTESEKADYQWRDSLYFLQNNESFIDSADRAYNQLAHSQWLWRGYHRKHSPEGQHYYFSPLLKSVNFNPVEGFNLQSTIAYEQVFDDRPDLRLEGMLRYGFSIGRLYAGIELSQGDFNVSAGRIARQMNRDEPVNESINSIYALTSAQNFMKLYEDVYAEMSYRFSDLGSIVPGFTVSFSQRDSLVNNASTSFASDAFEPNNPADFLPRNDNNEDEVSSYRFGRHEKFSLEASLQWVPFKRTVQYPDGREEVLSKGGPEINLSYRKALSGDFFEVDYDLAKGSVRHDFRWGLAGHTKWLLEGGAFLRNADVPFMDFYHFNGNQTLIRQEAANGFQLLDYYRFSTEEQFVNAHIEHSFNGFILNKLPVIRYFPASVVASANAFYLPSEEREYFEFSAGFEKIFGVLRVDYVRGFLDRSYHAEGVRIGVQAPFPGFSVK